MDVDVDPGECQYAPHLGDAHACDSPSILAPPPAPRPPPPAPRPQPCAAATSFPKKALGNSPSPKELRSPPDRFAHFARHRRERPAVFVGCFGHRRGSAAAPGAPCRARPAGPARGMPAGPAAGTPGPCCSGSHAGMAGAGGAGLSGGACSALRAPGRSRGRQTREVRG